VTGYDPNSTPNPSFPNLSPHNHRVIGPADHRFNCIAWACGETSRWWQPGTLYFWPVECDEDDHTIQSLIAACIALGFQLCESDELEVGFEKIAIYSTIPDEYTHAARQSEYGKWTSKLGMDVLIEHDTVDAVTGGVYGQLFGFMKRPKS
jgi:hypothetical protein